MLERRYPESYNLRRLKPDRLDVVAPTPARSPAHGLDNHDFSKIKKELEKLREVGILPPDARLF